MNNMFNMPPCAIRVYVERAMQIGREIGETCPYWINEDIYNSIVHEDKRVQRKLKEKYQSQTHEPRVIYRPDLKRVFVICGCCDNWSEIECNRLFPKIAEVFMKEMEKRDDRFGQGFEMGHF